MKYTFGAIGLSLDEEWQLSDLIEHDSNRRNAKLDKSAIVQHIRTERERNKVNSYI